MCARACAPVSLGGGNASDTWGAGWRGCWLHARPRDPSPSPAAGRGGGASRGSDRWTEPKGRGRADGVRDSAAGLPA